MISVKELYNQLAITTGFPTYTSPEDTPDTTRFLLEALARSLDSIVDILYISNNILERRDVIHATQGINKYGIDGIIKTITVEDEDGRLRELPFNANFNPNLPFEYDSDKTGRPDSYCISGGYLRLLPVPDKDYKLNLTLSTTRLVWSDNDTYKPLINDINDYVLCNEDMAVVVALRAAAFVFLRCKNANAQIYQDLCERRLKTLIEQCYKTSQASRMLPRSGGNYDSSTGLLG